MKEIFETMLINTSNSFYGRELLLCNMIRRRIDELHAFHLQHKGNIESKPI
jgi:hypothetical protein